MARAPGCARVALHSLRSSVHRGRLAYGVFEDGKWTVRGITLGFPTPKLFGVSQRMDWTQQTGRPGITVTTDGQDIASWFYPLLPSGSRGASE